MKTRLECHPERYANTWAAQRLAEHSHSSHLNQTTQKTANPNVPPVCAVAGIPAKVVKRRVTWSQRSKTVTREEKRFIWKIRKEIEGPKPETKTTRLPQWFAKWSRKTNQTS